MLFPFDYSCWARFGIGSEVSFASDRGGELNFTLIHLDGEKALLRCGTDRTGATSELGIPAVFTIPAARGHGIHAAPPRDLDPIRDWLRLHEPALLEEFDKFCRTLPTFPAPRESATAEGEEIIDVAGEDRLCRRVEIRCIFGDAEFRVTTWTSEGIPGGIVQLEIHGAETIPPSVWKLRSFEAVEGPP